MMLETVIKIEDLSKIYKLYEKPIDRLKEALNPLKRKYHDEFYALSNLSLEIKKGETVGIIGKNGSGKSTLLKIITGILSPSKGTLDIKGKVSALLELGTGFNPEFTGVQNIYLNGTIMGYSKEEMDAKLSNILEFADIGNFVYQPVKSYSSGMFARLAFAVAINVEPEILIVDEALSVGDFVFQYKCFMKFKELQSKGTTILFVSHSNNQIINYCNRAILLNEGILLEDSYDVEKVVFKYEELMRISKRTNEIIKPVEVLEINPSITNKSVNEHRFGSYDAIISNVYLTSKQNDWLDDDILKAGSTVYLKLGILSKLDINSVVIGASIKDVNGNVVWGDNSLEAEKNLSLKEGRNFFTFEFILNISAGEYLLYIGLADISGNERIELDQRWPVKKIAILSNRRMAEGYVFAPSKVYIE